MKVNETSSAHVPYLDLYCNRLMTVYYLYWFLTTSFFFQCWLGDISDFLAIKQSSKWKENWKSSESCFSALIRDEWNSNTVLFLDLELRPVWNLHSWKILLVRKSKEIGSVPCPLVKQQRVFPHHGIWKACKKILQTNWKKNPHEKVSIFHVYLQSQKLTGVKYFYLYPAPYFRLTARVL